MPRPTPAPLADLARDLTRELAGLAPPTAAEHAAWARTIRDPATPAGDREAAVREMVRRNLPLLLHAARRLARPGEDPGDLVGRGYAGLRRAAELFDPARGAAFGSYVYRWIRQAIGAARDASCEGVPYAIPAYLRVRHRQAARLRAELAGRGESITLAEAGRRLGLDAHAPYLDRADARLAAPADDEPGRDLDGLAGDGPPDEHADGDEAARAALALVDRLPGRERAVVRLWAGLDPVPGLEDAPARTADRPSALIARHLGLSRERVRQIRAAAIDRLRGWAATEASA